MAFLITNLVSQILHLILGAIHVIQAHPNLIRHPITYIACHARTPGHPGYCTIITIGRHFISARW